MTRLTSLVTKLFTVGLSLSAGVVARAADAPDFTREVRPILSHHCLKCHGPDDKSRKGKLRLDIAEAARVAAKSGELAIVAGHPEKGTLVARITSNDSNEVMPPPATKNPLTAVETDILKRWIAAGAVYKEHWAFIPPSNSPPPAVKDAWVRNPIDAFVLQRLHAAGLQPSAEVDRATLIRRLSLDLIGLPPTPAEVDAFVNDASGDAYEKLVDRLLASPHYGERWARRWLDLARYADTNGYEKDRTRSVWPWRDWVINAFNADKPFDRFTVEQLAGDMLPGATVEDRIATGFHRNTMLNEEGGIDPQEFRWKAVVDRNNVTATAWLGLTLQCAQCHTHKFDPIPHQEYYQMMAFLNDADEPVMPVMTPDLVSRRKSLEEQIVVRTADLPNRFPIRPQQIKWQVASAMRVASAGGAVAEPMPDGSVLFTGAAPERDTYTVTFESDASNVSQLKLEALQDPSLPKNGPGRAINGNFVLNQITVKVEDGHAPARDVKLVSATADFSQNGWPVAGAIDSNPQTGWAGETTDSHMGNRTAAFTFTDPVSATGKAKWTVRLEQAYGQRHTFGRFRLSLGQDVATADQDAKPVEVRRREVRDKAFDAWLAAEMHKAVKWTVLTPTELKSNLPILKALPDGSVLASGDQTKRDVYDVTYRAELHGITGIRLEAMPDESLPSNGPGRTFYEGQPGDFFLSELTATANGQPVQLKAPTGANAAAAAIDGNPLTGWSVGGGNVGKTSMAYFTPAAPLDVSQLSFELVCEKYFSSPIGRFRISVTSDPRPITPGGLPAEVESVLAEPEAGRSPTQRDVLLNYFCSVAPELATERAAIDALRKQIPGAPTTLVLQERAAGSERPTFVHHRGEYLQPEERVKPGVLSVLPALPKDAPANRLTFARWLVDGRNPLTSRVTVNRQWAAFFGRGIVRTTQDFGYQGDPPTHPELLDWLAVEFVKQGWSLKKLNRLIVTSAAYRQTSRVTPELLEKDPDDRLLSRGPRFRLDAELIRDYALKVSGLLSDKMLGPSVFPPQPASVTTEGAYGALAWNISQGEDRYRRGLYTFMKRTAPYAMFTTFDAPSGEECVARRDISDTPLQALTLLNDTVFTEVVQSLGRQTAEQTMTDTGQRADYLFRRVLCRNPDADERKMVVDFFEAQRARFEKKELDASKVAGLGATEDRAAWTAVARSLLNLDEAVTKG